MLRRSPQLAAGRNSIGPWCAILAAIAGLGPIGAARALLAGISTAPPERAPPDSTTLLTIVRDPQTDRNTRVEAARDLLEDEGAAEQVAALGAALSNPGVDGQTKSTILDAIARTAATPSALYEPVARLVAAAGNEDLPFILPALASFRTRDSARLLLSMADGERPWPVRSAAFAALIRLSGRDDLGTDVDAWRRWLDRASILSEADWREQIAADQAGRADRLAALLGATQQELAPIYRRLYGQLPPSERPRLLAEMIKDDREELRTLGFQLAALELSAGQTLPAVVSDAAISLLSDVSPQTRARAAVLVDQLAAEGADTAITDALNRETDPDAAAAMLAAVARWPSAVARASILAWLDKGPITRPVAAKAALALFKADLLNAQADRSRAAGALRSVPLERLGAAELRLLVLVGNDEDRKLIAGMLDSAMPTARLAAAEALSGRKEFLDRLIQAASRDSDLFSSVAAAAAASNPTAATYQAVAALRAPDAETGRAGLLLISNELSAAELLTVARETDDEAFAAALLDRLQTLAVTSDAAGAAAVATAIELLANLRLDLGQPDRALSAVDLLDTLRSRFPSLPTDQAADLRVTALLCLDRIDRAAAAQGNAQAWIRGLTLSKSQPHARRIASEVRARFAGRMTPDQLVEFALLESQIAALEEEERARRTGPPEPPQSR